MKKSLVEPLKKSILYIAYLLSNLHTYFLKINYLANNFGISQIPFFQFGRFIFLCYGSALRAKKSYFQEALCSKNIRIIELKQMFCWLCDIQNQLALMRKDSQK